jgi:hypothetical protein
VHRILEVHSQRLTAFVRRQAPFGLRDPSRLDRLGRRAVADAVDEDRRDLGSLLLRLLQDGIQETVGFVGHARQCSAVAVADALRRGGHFAVMFSSHERSVPSTARALVLQPG